MKANEAGIEKLAKAKKTTRKDSDWNTGTHGDMSTLDNLAGQ